MCHIFSTEFALVKEIVNLDVNIKIPLWTFLKGGGGGFNNLLEVVAGADPGLWERGGPINIFTTGGGGVPPPVTARGSGGALLDPTVGSGAKPQKLIAFAFI